MNQKNINLFTAYFINKLLLPPLPTPHKLKRHPENNFPIHKLIGFGKGMDIKHPTSKANAVIRYRELRLEIRNSFPI